jgi:penicillin-binding protein-related factor A (putative recombinase)
MNSVQDRKGAEVEALVCAVLRRHRYWAHDMARSASGAQPADVAAMRGGSNYLIDAKNVRPEEISFPFSRIEPNQRQSMEYALTVCGITGAGFAVRFERDGRLMFLPFQDVKRIEAQGRKSARPDEMSGFEEEIERK